jgi:predicted PurR-regulated permease PerM
LVGLRIVAELREVLILFFIAVLFASAISRPAAMLERRGVPRPRSRSCSSWRWR